MRQLLTEIVLLAAAGGGLGLLLAFWILELVVAWKPSLEFTVTIDFKMDQRVLSFTLLLSLLTGVLGLIPARQATKTDLVPALKVEGSMAGYRRSGLRNGLIVAQIGTKPHGWQR